MRTRSLDFSRGAERLVVRSERRLHVVDVGGSAAPRLIAIPDVHDFVTLDGELWVVAGLPPTLHRIAFDGEPIGAPVVLGGSHRHATLQTAAFGARFAIWSGSPALSLVADGDTVTSLPIPGDFEEVVPVGPTRWLTCKHGLLRLRDLATERWAVNAFGRDGTIVTGAAIFDGRNAALEVLAPGSNGAGPSSALVVVSLRDGAIQRRMTIAGVTMLRIAAQRGHALVLAGSRLFLVDLRFGRVIGEHESAEVPIDFAIDPTAQHLALRLGERETDVACMSVRDVLHASATRTTLAPDGEAAAPASIPAPTPPPAEVTVAVAVAFQVGHAPLGDLHALQPRPTIAPIESSENDEVLRRYHQLLTSLVGRAIAVAWDQGRLTFPNEGAHPFLSEVTGLLGRTRGKAHVELAVGNQEVAEATRAAHLAEQACAPRVPPLLALTRELGVSDLGRSILLLVAGPTLWGDLARLYGILANDEGRELVDEWLITQIMAPGVAAEAIARELDRDQPLLRYGLIRVGTNRMSPFAGLSCEPIVLRLLRRAPVEHGLEDLRVIEQTRSFAELLIPAAVKDALVHDLGAPTDPAGMRIVVRGRTGAGRHTLLATLAAAAQRRLGAIDISPLARDPKALVERLRTALRRAHVLGFLPCIDGLETLASDDQTGNQGVREVVRSHPGPLAIRLPREAQPPIDPGYLMVDLPTLTISERLTCWAESLARHRLHVREVLELATRYAIGAGVIERVSAGVDTTDATPGVDHQQQLDTAIRQHLESRLGTIAHRVTRLTSWSHVILPPEIQESLLELIARITHRGLVFDTWGFDSVMATTRGVTALFQGGPGTGKTLVAGAIANELGMDLYRVDMSRIMSKWIGETEQNLAKLFDAAEDGHAIILFDEADSLFSRRTEVRTSVDRYANLEVNYLLQRLDTFEGIAILTTNFGTGIDNAFRRRLSFRLTFPFPDEEMREQLWKAHLPAGAPTSGAFDMAELARRYRLSGGYIRNAALRAAFLAAEERTPITQDHLERAIKAEFREIGKLADSGVLE